MDISYKLTPTYNYYWVDSYESGRGASQNLGARGGGGRRYSTTFYMGRLCSKV